MNGWNRLLEFISIENKKQITKNQKDELLKDGCLFLFNDYKRNGSLKHLKFPNDFVVSLFYDYLKSKGLINQSIDVKKEIYNSALTEYKNNIEKYYKLKQFNKQTYYYIIDNIKENRVFINVCKRYSIKKYFDELILNQRDIVINNDIIDL